MTALNGHAANGTMMNGTTHDDSWPPKPFDDQTAERQRLEQELTSARERVALAREQATRREHQVKAALREELVASRERLTEMDRRHDERIAEIRAAADAEVERIIAAAGADAGRSDG
jgi:hypothetical protein